MLKIKKIKESEFICGDMIRKLYRKENNSFITFGKNVDSFIKENYEFILQKRVKNELCDILDILFERDSMCEFIKSKMLYTMRQASAFEWFKILDRGYDFDWKSFFNENIDGLLETLDYKKIFEIIKFVNDLNEEVKEKINNILIKERKEYVKHILFSKLDYDEKNKEYNDLLDIVIKLVEEVLKSENKRFVDIQILGIGAYSDVIEIGTKIIKLGTRQLNEIAYDHRILFPIIKFDFNKISSLNVVLEVTEKADNNIELDRTKLYKIYLDMRRRGIICADMRKENVGILLKDNIPVFEGKIFDNFETKGILYLPQNREILKKGEYVIIDLDYIYRESAVDVKWANLMTREFEKRYKDEELDEMINKVYTYVKK